ncbi:MAG: hypothetical protein PHD39_12390 [Methylobacter tundripaludum]|nr:hypothetical protein [Methylobacter tundripaludum]MDD4906937.1 hypothetical protein [Methylobacter tundripaludum]
MFILTKASVVPFYMALKLLNFVGVLFVGKLTKLMDGYDKRGGIGAMA